MQGSLLSLLPNQINSSKPAKAAAHASTAPQQTGEELNPSENDHPSFSFRMWFLRRRILDRCFTVKYVCGLWCIMQELICIYESFTSYKHTCVITRGEVTLTQQRRQEKNCLFELKQVKAGFENIKYQLKPDRHNRNYTSVSLTATNYTSKGFGCSQILHDVLFLHFLGIHGESDFRFD